MLVVDDEPQIRRFLDISLRAQGYHVETAEHGEAGLQAMAMHGADLVSSTSGLPGIDGHEVLARLREWSQVPVILLTVRADEAEKVRALDAGANDYVTKPFGVQELMARVRALLRPRTAAGDPSPVSTMACCASTGVARSRAARRTDNACAQGVRVARPAGAAGGRVVTQPQMLRELWASTTSMTLTTCACLSGSCGKSSATTRRAALDRHRTGVGLRFIVARVA